MRDLKQARTATAVNKQLNFNVKNKPQTTGYRTHCKFSVILWLKVCEGTLQSSVGCFIYDSIVSWTLILKNGVITIKWTVKTQLCRPEGIVGEMFINKSANLNIIVAMFFFYSGFIRYRYASIYSLSIFNQAVNNAMCKL